MITKTDRIAELRARAAECRKKMETLEAVQKLRAKAEASEALAEKMEVQEKKERADQLRRDDKHGKIILGAGSMLLAPQLRSFVLRAIQDTLTQRDRKWIATWCQTRGVEIADSTPSAEFTFIPDPVGAALKNVISMLSEAEAGLLIPELLNQAQGDDRVTLEIWLSSRTDN